MRELLEACPPNGRWRDMRGYSWTSRANQHFNPTSSRRSGLLVLLFVLAATAVLPHRSALAEGR